MTGRHVENAVDGKPFNLSELLEDAEFCGRLSEWESDFLDDLRGRALLNAGTVRLSEKQMAVLRRIEKKVYAT